jgi:hypothetical protein
MDWKMVEQARLSGKLRRTIHRLPKVLIVDVISGNEAPEKIQHVDGLFAQRLQEDSTFLEGTDDKVTKT